MRTQCHFPGSWRGGATRLRSLVSWLQNRNNRESVQGPFGLHMRQSYLQSSQNAFPNLLSTLLFPLPDPKDWRFSVLSAPHPVLDSLQVPDAYLILVASGPLISCCVKELPERLVKCRNWGHTPKIFRFRTSVVGPKVLHF